MKAVGDFTPWNSAESDVLEFDFTKDLAVGDSVASVTNWTMAVASGTDPDPQFHVSGPPTLTGNKTQQRITQPIAGNIYTVTALVHTTLGNDLELWAFLACLPIGIPQNNNFGR